MMSTSVVCNLSFWCLVILELLFLVTVTAAQIDWFPCDETPLSSSSNRLRTILHSYPFNGGIRSHTVRKSDKSVKQTLEENWIQECARITVPLDWLRPTSYKNITLFIRRFHPNQTAPLNQLWLLDGGPGGDGSGLGPLIGIPIAQMMKTPLTVYVPSHRGTGLSSCLGCNISACMNVHPERCAKQLYETYGNDTFFFTTTNAAKDLAYAINLIAQSNRNTGKIFIYGLSYGTYWLNRYLVLFPKQADAAILDGICPPDLCRIDVYDRNWNSVILITLQSCVRQSVSCARYLGAWPTQILYLLQQRNYSDPYVCQQKTLATYRTHNFYAEYE